MPNIRDQFHDINNQLNNITVKVGVAKEMLKMKTKDNALGQKDLDAHIKELNAIEQAAFRAAEMIKKLKEEIYSQLEIDK